MSTVNIFTRYEQKENDFTNGLIALLSLARVAIPELLPSFLHDELGIEPDGEVDSFCVLRGIQGTADGQLRGQNCCIQFETKIVSGTLRSEQIVNHHLKNLRSRRESLRRLVLLTPDDSKSQYVQRFLSLDRDFILHLGWKRVYDFLRDSVAKRRQCAFSELVNQFLVHIHEMVFKQDIAGIIAKINFGETSQVFEGSYLAEMKEGKKGIGIRWNTPREYKNLDGTGRKLLLYDRKKQGITAEVEIQSVKRTDVEPGFPWTNEYAPGTLRFFEPPISLSRIRNLPGFANFGLHKKDRSPYRNITHEEYRQLAEEKRIASLTGEEKVLTPYSVSGEG
jgi:hypothetical protein